MPEFPVSSIVDNILLLSLVELQTTLHRCIAVVKARSCTHQFDTREFTIGPGGISLLPLNRTVEPVSLPIEDVGSPLGSMAARSGDRKGPPIGRAGTLTGPRELP